MVLGISVFSENVTTVKPQKFPVLRGHSKEHSAILLTYSKLPFVIKIFILSILSGRLRQGLL